LLTLIYGGTFDPIHIGHVALADQAAKLLHAEVRLLPAADPPHRAQPGASAEHRAKMVALAIEGHPGLRLDCLELERQGPSYMADTLMLIRQNMGPSMPLALLLGSDAFHGLASWHRWNDLFLLAHLVVAPREGWPLDDLPEALANACQGRWLEHPETLGQLPAGGVYQLPLRALQPESASELRRRLTEGGDWRSMVAPAVADYIQRHGLYRPAR
jgi:nicotinate-nucleotide adenylyltransferase